MKRILLILGAFTLCLVALAAQSSVVASARIHHIHGSDHVAFALFSRMEGKLVTSTDIQAIRGFHRALPEEPNPTSYLNASIPAMRTTSPWDVRKLREFPDDAISHLPV